MIVVQNRAAVFRQLRCSEFFTLLLLFGTCTSLARVQSTRVDFTCRYYLLARVAVRIRVWHRGNHLAIGLFTNWVPTCTVYRASMESTSTHRYSGSVISVQTNRSGLGTCRAHAIAHRNTPKHPQVQLFLDTHATVYVRNAIHDSHTQQQSQQCVPMQSQVARNADDLPMQTAKQGTNTISVKACTEEQLAQKLEDWAKTTTLLCINPMTDNAQVERDAVVRCMDRVFSGMPLVKALVLGKAFDLGADVHRIVQSAKQRFQDLQLVCLPTTCGAGEQLISTNLEFGIGARDVHHDDRVAHLYASPCCNIHHHSMSPPQRSRVRCCRSNLPPLHQRPCAFWIFP